jgi:hypothetical protein
MNGRPPVIEIEGRPSCGRHAAISQNGYQSVHGWLLAGGQARNCSRLFSTGNIFVQTLAPTYNPAKPLV